MMQAAQDVCIEGGNGSIGLSGEMLLKKDQKGSKEPGVYIKTEHPQGWNPQFTHDLTRNVRRALLHIE